jgi:hypothetical protein
MPAGSSPHRLRARQTASLFSRSQSTTPARLVLAETADELNAGGIKGCKKRQAGQALVKRDKLFGAVSVPVSLLAKRSRKSFKVRDRPPSEASSRVLAV